MLVTGGSGVAMGLPHNLQRDGASQPSSSWRGVPGPGLILSGSCSGATRGQVARYSAGNPAMKLDPSDVTAGCVTAKGVLDWCERHKDAVPLVYASDTPEAVAAAQAELGKDAVAEAMEGLFADVAGKAAAAGYTRIVAAGGETSGAVVKGLGSVKMQIGPEIAPGVPAMLDPDLGIAMALKSGNFGDAEFFAKALRVLEEQDV